MIILTTTTPKGKIISSITTGGFAMEEFNGALSPDFDGDICMYPSSFIRFGITNGNDFYKTSCTLSEVRTEIALIFEELHSIYFINNDISDYIINRDECNGMCWDFDFEHIFDSKISDEEITCELDRLIREDNEFLYFMEKRHNQGATNSHLEIDYSTPYMLTNVPKLIVKRGW